VAGSGGLTAFGYLLVLRGTDAVFEAVVSAVQQAVEYFYLLFV
tara:strand:+ start:99837 stop:99965 length:129 start_codon:yes stop_codon:yes gene_type:complete